MTLKRKNTRLYRRSLRDAEGCTCTTAGRQIRALIHIDCTNLEKAEREPSEVFFLVRGSQMPVSGGKQLAPTQAQEVRRTRIKDAGFAQPAFF